MSVVSADTSTFAASAAAPSPRPPLPAPGVPRAHRITSDDEALTVARELAAQFAVGAVRRDAERSAPVAEIEAFSNSGLWGMTVPKAYGGAGVSNVTLAEVIKTISVADPSIGQIPQNHLYMIEALRLDGTEAQKQYFFDLALRGYRFGNAFSEVGTKNVLDVRTRIVPDAHGDGFRITGKKFYSSGALLAHWIPVVAVDDLDHTVVGFVQRGDPGLTLIDDWTSFGQRTTCSGTTILDAAHVREGHVIEHWLAFERPTTMGPIAQIIQAAVDTGIAVAALADTVTYLRQSSRPWIDSNVEKATDDPLTLFRLGEVQIRVHAAEAILLRAAQRLDIAQADPTVDTVADAAIAVAESKAMSEDAAIFAADRLHELAGTRSTLGAFGLDRHWRNARTHTLHDPSRWKYHAIGNYLLNGTPPPRHPWF
jgi:SfnB family sulfur acquisition oxidoreductase